MYPFGNLVADSAGNLYGTTQSGGANDAGTIFRLSPGTDGERTETILHNFTGRSDGGYPQAGLVFDPAGSLYGTGSSGGLNGTGVIFKLSPQSGGWNYNVIYSFGPYPGSDGFAPDSALVIDKLGNLYGSTYEGGDDSGCFEGCGTVFELSPDDKGWSEQVIHVFSPNSSDGELPAGVVFGLDGALYGTSEGGGVNDHGTVFETTYSKTSGWSTTVLYSFGQSYSGDVFPPQASVVMHDGSLYGTATYGGEYNYYGGVFKLSKSSDGVWSDTVLYSFNGTTGDSPEGDLLLQGGLFYGTSRLGGDNSGLVYAVKP
jgi:uncharacterized repeat protein (TIGR03803 family)